MFDNIVVPLMCKKTKKGSTSEKPNEATPIEILKSVGLAEKANLLAADLPHGDLKRLELAKSLASKPDLLLLDEPF